MSGQTTIYARKSSYLDRWVELSLANGRAVSMMFQQEVTEATSDYELVDRIFSYLGGNHEDFSGAPIALAQPPTQRAVLETTREIPYCEQVSVERLAGMTAGLDGDSRDDQLLVRTALAANPLPLLIPDHRVRDGPSGAPPRVELLLRSLEDLH